MALRLVQLLTTYQGNISPTCISEEKAACPVRNHHAEDNDQAHPQHDFTDVHCDNDLPCWHGWDCDRLNGSICSITVNMLTGQGRRLA